MGHDNAALGYCEHCEKRSYADRKDARKAAKLYATHKSPYRCPVHPILWHVGELSPVVIRGFADRETYYQREAS